MLLIWLLVGPRILYRIWHDRETRQDIDAGAEKVLIVGAGTAAEMLIRDLMRATPRRYEPVALVDDDHRKQGRELHGVRVVGGCNTIPLFAGR
jgi:FlaA1/EpsC-like NDP-sugar epimerase